MGLHPNSHLHALERTIVEAAIQRSQRKWRQTLRAELGYEKNALQGRLEKWGPS